MVNCINLIIEMSPRFPLGRENVPCVAEVVNRSLKADCTDFTHIHAMHAGGRFGTSVARLGGQVCQGQLSLPSFRRSVRVIRKR